MFSHDMLLGRWRLALELFSRIFVDDVGAEAGSVISDLGGFPVKEMRFRREMEKLRNSQQRDITLLKVSFLYYGLSSSSRNTFNSRLLSSKARYLTNF